MTSKPTQKSSIRPAHHHGIFLTDSLEQFSIQFFLIQDKTKRHRSVQSRIRISNPHHHRQRMLQHFHLGLLKDCHLIIFQAGNLLVAPKDLFFKFLRCLFFHLQIPSIIRFKIAGCLCIGNKHRIIPKQHKTGSGNTRCHLSIYQVLLQVIHQNILVCRQGIPLKSC